MTTIGVVLTHRLHRGRTRRPPGQHRLLGQPASERGSELVQSLARQAVDDLLLVLRRLEVERAGYVCPRRRHGHDRRDGDQDQFGPERACEADGVVDDGWVVVLRAGRHEDPAGH
jgi:hypothetical protein